jgi:hypothetical protein
MSDYEEDRLENDEETDASNEENDDEEFVNDTVVTSDDESESNESSSSEGSHDESSAESSDESDPSPEPLQIILPARLPTEYIQMAKKHFSLQSVNQFVSCRVQGRAWTPSVDQLVRIRMPDWDSCEWASFVDGKKGYVLHKSTVCHGKLRVTVDGSLSRRAAEKETGFAIAPGALAPVSNLKLHLNTVKHKDLELLPWLVEEVTPAVVHEMQHHRPFNNWPDLRRRVPSLTEDAIDRLHDFIAVTTVTTNSTWRAFSRTAVTYTAQLKRWAAMTATARAQCIEQANEEIELEKQERTAERLKKRAAEQASRPPPPKRPKRMAAMVADEIGYSETNSAALRRMESDAWAALQ